MTAAATTLPDTTRSCPACHSRKRKEIGFKNSFQIFRCECGTLYTANAAGEVVHANYDSYYSETNLSTPAFVRERLAEIVGKFQPFYKTGALLDVGFGAGDLLSVARELGWNACGVEVSATAVKHGQELGLDVRHGDLISANYPDDNFDVVTAVELIEHCADPEILLREVYRILRPGGLFWATTPAAGGLSFRLIGLGWSTVCPPEHLQLFSRRGAYEFLSKFSSAKVFTHAFNPAEVMAHFRKREPAFDRVGSAYVINEKLTSSKKSKFVKSMLNGTLNILGFGESLKIFAVK